MSGESSTVESSDSSEELFFDAEDTTPNRNTRKRSPKVKSDGFTFPESHPGAQPTLPLATGTLLPHTVPPTSIAASLDDDSSDAMLAKLRSDDANLRATGKNHLRDEFAEPKTLVPPSGRQRFRELRQCMQNDEDENPGNTLTPDSQNSSVEGVFAAQRPSHPFRIIENDAMSIQSMTSLGRVGRILAGSVDPSGISIGRDSNHLSTSASVSGIPQTSASSFPMRPTSQSSSTDLNRTSAGETQFGTTNYRRDSGDRKRIMTPELESDECSLNRISLQEPDVIASTKLTHSKTTDNILSAGPVAPPRRKKKGRKLSSSSSEQFNMNDGLTMLPIVADLQKPLTIFMPPKSGPMESTQIKPADQSLPSPLSAVESITRELENTFAEETIPTSRKRSVGGSIGRICHSLGNSSTSVYSKPSPSNSAKSNSAPGRVSSIDPNQSLNIYKATRGQYVVKPQDEAANKAEGSAQEAFNRVVRIKAELLGPMLAPGESSAAMAAALEQRQQHRFALSGTGSNSLGSDFRYGPSLSRLVIAKDRRKSAGDEDIMKQLNVFVRTRTDSGKPLTDLEILEQVPVKNLDTGEKFPLSAVEDKIPVTDLNPLSLHILRLTSHLQRESDEESVGRPPGSEVPPGDEEELEVEEGGRLKRKTARIKRFFGSTMRKTVDKAKSIASEVSHARHKEDVADIMDVANPEQSIKIKASNTNKGPYDFTKLQHVQDLSGEHTGAVWCMKFSSCGRLLATAGQDKVLRIWVLKDAYPFFLDMRTKYNADQKSSPTPSQESLVSHTSAEEAIAMAVAAEKSTGPFMPRSFCSYTGHTSDLLDVSWSKNYFILSSSMDKTVRLWHISRKECLCCFQHIDFVTAIAFHPRDDRYFLSGSLDGKLRLWNIPDKKVALWNELDGQTKLITAANFCQNGKFAVVGSYDGRCIFYNTDQLKYHTQIHVRSTRGKNSTGRKISGIEPMPGEDKILVTSNDSRIRLYDLRDLNLSCKYKGYMNVSSQIKASFSHDGKYIISGSENQCIFVWKTNHDYSKLSSVRRDRSDFWEGIKAHNATVTCAIFAPHPEAIIKPEIDDEIPSQSASQSTPDPMVEQHKKGCGYVLVSADFNGAIKVYVNKTKPKHSSLPYTAILD